MVCASPVISKGDKGVGTRLFIDFENCTGVQDPDADPLVPDGTNSYTEVECVTEVTPPGGERDEDEDDGCLAVDDIIQGVGPRKFTSASATVRTVPGDAVDDAMRALLASADTVSVVIKHPVGDDFIYEWFDAKLTQYAPQSITKRDFRTSQIRLTPQTASYMEDDPEALGSGLADASSS